MKIDIDVAGKATKLIKPHIPTLLFTGTSKECGLYKASDLLLGDQCV